jgi:hypothetical protein
MIASPGRSGWVLFSVSLTLLIAVKSAPLQAQQGNSQRQILSLVPNKLEFGSVPVGTKTQPQAVILTNSGPSTLPIAGILVSGIDFTQRNNCGTQLAAGAQCSIQITFQPAISGPRLGTAIVTTSNDPASPYIIELNGAGQ